LEKVDIFYVHLEYCRYRHFEYFMTIWYILCSLGTFFPVLESYTMKNLATLGLWRLAAVHEGKKVIEQNCQKTLCSFQTKLFLRLKLYVYVM
jgi:hypothetical protein